MSSAIFQTIYPIFLHFFQKSLLRNFWYEVRHSMIKSASIVRNLSKIHTFRTIASILFRFPANFNWAKPPFPRNLIHAIPPFPANLAEFYNINSAIAGVMNHPIGYNDSVIHPQLYPIGIIQHSRLLYILGIFHSIILKTYATTSSIIAVAFHRLCTNRHIEQFCGQNRFTYFYV